MTTTIEYNRGSTATNAASEFYQVYVNCSKKDNTTTLPELLNKINKLESPVFTIRYEKGHLKLVDIIEFSEMVATIEGYDYSGIDLSDWSTVVTFKANLDIYESHKSSVAQLPLKLVKLESPKSEIVVNNSLIDDFDFSKDIYSSDDSLLGKYFSTQVDIPELESSFTIYFTYDKDAKFDYQHTSLVNLVETTGGGYIEDLVWRSIGDSLKSFNPLLKQADGKLGLRLFVSSFTGLKMFFNSQTKEKLAKLSYKDDIKQKPIDKKEFIQYLVPEISKIINDPDNKDYFSIISDRIIEYKRSMDRLTKKDFVLSHINYSDSKNPTKSLGLTSRVFDCTSTKVEDRELYIVEGSSASSTLVMTRNPKTLAVLPLRGMVLNTANSSLERVLENPELKSIVNVLGSGIHPFVKMGNRRYDKVIISTDGDSAGKMIAGLLLGFFAKFLPEWIELGKVFILVSPLYKQNGKFIYDNSELDTKKPFSRFKG